MTTLSYSDIIKSQSESFLEIQKKQNDMFLETLANITKTNIELINKLESERDYYRNLYISNSTTLINNNLDNKSFDGCLVEECKSGSDKENIEHSSTKQVNVSPFVSNNNYREYINNYLRDKNENTFCEIIEKYPEYIFDTLKLCKNSLPSNINTIAELYNFKNDLEKLNQRIINLNKLSKNEKIDIQDSYKELCDKFHNAIVKNKPRLVNRFIKQIYVQYPDMFDNFTKTYSSYLPLNLEEILNKIKKEYSVDLTSDIDIKQKNKKQHIDYLNIDINELVQLVSEKTNKAQYIKLYTLGLQKAGRDQEIIEKFINETKNRKNENN